MSRLRDKVALVTGAASRPGLGSATAARFAQEGAIVYLTDIDDAGAHAVAEAITQAGGIAKAQQHDVSSEADWQRVVQTITREQLRLDILVNNAGIAVLSTIERVTPADWAKQINVNMTSVYLGTQLGVEQMRKNGGGSIINMSSVVGLVGVPGCSAYAASKGGVRLFTKSVAIETAKEKIRVNSIHPGMIKTNMQGDALQQNPDFYDIVAAGIPMGYMGEPLDIANCALYLASDESRYVTGAEFVVDGGMTAQ